MNEVNIELASKLIEGQDLKIKKLKIHQFKEINKFKAFIEIEETIEAVKAYDVFYKGKFNGAKSSVYLLVDDHILKDFTIKEIEKHE